eukprot:SM000125S26070  [mRNA]  locus=s125:158700:159648:- [translate_table: standard]
MAAPPSLPSSLPLVGPARLASDCAVYAALPAAAGTQNSDQARDFDLPLKERFFLQALPPSEALARAKESASQIVSVKGLIDKKAWPYVQNDLRSKAGYLRFDLNTVIGAKAKAEKKELTKLANKLYDSIADLDYAARAKSPAKAATAYDNTVSLLGEVLSKLA